MRRQFLVDRMIDRSIEVDPTDSCSVLNGDVTRYTIR